MNSDPIKKQAWEKFEKRKKIKFINSLSGFKSANLVGTVDENSVVNLSIVSSFFHLGSDPALVGFVIRPDVSPRHTLDNIRKNKKCTLNHVNSNIYQKAHQTSARYDKEKSEFLECGLTEEYLNDFLAPFVKESTIKMSLEIQNEILIEENGTHLLIGKIKDVYLPDIIVSEDGYIDIEKAQSVCVSSLDSYHLTKRITRLSYAKPEQQLTEIDL